MRIETLALRFISRNSVPRTLLSLFLATVLITAVAPWAVGQDLAARERAQTTEGPTVIRFARMLQARSGHTATVLRDGRVLIVGGENEYGPVGIAEVYDPASGTFKSVGDSGAGRTGQASILLPDGRVLITGGRDFSGPVNSTSFYDPASERFVPGPEMFQARSGHTVTDLGQGWLLLAGGDAEGTAEVFDPTIGKFTLLSRLAGEPRSNHSAVLLQDGSVLIGGGVSASGSMLNTGIIYDPVSGESREITTPMRAARVAPLLRVLSDGKAQIIGGDEAGTMEMYNPESVRFTALAKIGDGGLATVLRLRARPAFAPDRNGRPADDRIARPDGNSPWLVSDLADTTGYTISELSAARQVLFAGGKTSSETLAAATVIESSAAEVTTDQTDYYPGDTVIISGSGFEPGEMVQLVLEVQKDGIKIQDDIVLESQADENGQFQNSEFVVDESHLGATFLLTATGQTSGITAQTTFTDAPKVGSVTVGTQTGSLTAGTGGSVTFTVTVNRGSGGGSSGNFTADLTITTALPTGVTASFSPNPVSLNPGDTSRTATLTLTTTAASPAGSTSFTVRARTSASDFADGNRTLVINGRPLTVTADAKSKFYGDGDPALTYSSGPLIPGDSFSGALTRNPGENVGTYPITQGTLKIMRGAPPVDVTGSYILTFVSVNLTVNARPITVTADAKSKVYGEADPALTYQVTSGSLKTGDSFSGALTRAAGENVGKYAINQGTLTLGTNYTITFVSADLEITPRAIGVTADPQTKIYGNADPTLTYKVTSGSLKTGDSFSGALARATGENVGKYAITQGTLALSANYTLSFTGAELEITPRAIGVTADPETKTYGDADPTLTYQVTSGSLKTGDSFSGALARAAGENVGKYAITQGTLALSANYTLGFTGAELEITPRAVTVTADGQTKVLGAGDPALTYQVTSGSLVGAESFTGQLTRVPGEAVGPHEILQGTLKLSSNYQLNYIGANLTIRYAGPNVACNGQPCHTILQPINPDGSSVFKKGSTVPAKFRACDLFGNSIGTPGVVAGFFLVGREAAGNVAVNEPVDSTTPDTAFRWSSSDQLWIFNISTKNLSAGVKYVFEIALNDGSKISFKFGLK